MSTSLCANLSTTPLRQTALLPSGGGVLGKHPNTDQRGTCPSGLLPIPCQWQLIGHALELFSASAYQASHLGVRSRMEQDHADTAVESTFIRDADGACSGLLVSSNVASVQGRGPRKYISTLLKIFSAAACLLPVLPGPAPNQYRQMAACDWSADRFPISEGAL